MPVIPLDGIPQKHIPIVRTDTMRDMLDLPRTGTLREGLRGNQHPYPFNIAEAYSTFGGCWPTATSYSYSWKRNGKAVTAATKSTYVLVKADKGQKVTVTVTAHRYGWTSGSATIAPVTVH
ncbi:hypothetical protein [Streptomyces sp. CA-106110]|uniref:hypothetical protein n=1 Tax=Streptomyces sp. CA-106110 TaxID=3240044 RepID=UPI003D8FA435